VVVPPFIQAQTPILQNTTASLLKKPTFVQLAQPAPPPPIEYKRKSKLNLKCFHQIKNILEKPKINQPTLQASRSRSLINSNETIKLKSHTNEKIYNLIDLFAESANNLNKFNSTTEKNDKYQECNNTSTANIVTSLFVHNPNASDQNIQNLTRQLSNLLDYMSYKSATSPISTDLFSSFIAASLTESSMSTTSPASNSLLIIDRVEFVSKNLNDELISIIQYCLNASFTTDGHISSCDADRTRNSEVSSCQIPSLLSFATIQPGGKLYFRLNLKF